MTTLELPKLSPLQAIRLARKYGLGDFWYPKAAPTDRELFEFAEKWLNPRRLRWFYLDWRAIASGKDIVDDIYSFDHRVGGCRH